MDKWIIERYNQGQSKYTGSIIPSDYFDQVGIFVSCIEGTLKGHGVPIYDFLFNPKYEFAKAFWGDEGEILDGGYTNVGWWQYHLMLLAITEDKLEYLRSFKE